ncbi:sensor histidine kinase [Chitinophaga nivalis]|uniref:Histidine kinase n=1 Tax=Chitinophaga nivalis TaxID=2991709 RepID=A0ABT3IRW4_9BACT|nr:histidine kinase [Chitinophaga nivalis]MCW3463590.1 histidine kinase [Chitinophaga nivalis]MCW3486720.1 histidine kinase [Chitinophaga nivalis]
MAKQLYKGSAWWALVTSFAVWLLLYAGLLYYWFDFTPGMAFTDSSVHVILLGAVCIVITRNLAYYRPGAGTMKFGYVGLISTLLTALWVFFARWILVTTYETDIAYIRWLNNAIPIHYIVGIMIVTGIGLRSQIWYDEAEKQDARERKDTVEKIAREAELFKLRQQLQPHFLFNSLNSINALIMLRPKQAREMVLKLSEFLRGSLKREDVQWVSLLDELQYLQLYLDIEQVRFGHRLTTNVIHDPSAENMQMPPMLLQPVVENAIKFGLYDTTEEIAITIRAWAADEMLYIEVKNPFDYQMEQPNRGTGFGLKSIRRRLYLLFARQDLLETATHENIYTTLIKVPQTHDKSSNN